MTDQAPTDRFGNPIDPVVGYARGTILRSTDEEVVRMLRARHMVGERGRSIGKESVFDLSGMNRGAGIGEEEVPHLTSHVPFFERFEGRTEPYALRHMGADPKRHKALIINRADAIARTLRSPDVVDGLAKQGATAGALTQPQFADYVSAEVDKWAKVVKESGAKID